jgi:hypothetical protein
MLWTWRRRAAAKLWKTVVAFVEGLDLGEFGFGPSLPLSIQKKNQIGFL